MECSMKQWREAYLQGKNYKAIPILSFPGASLVGYTVEELVKSGEKQAQCMEAVAKRYSTGASVSLMDLSVEAECFGANIVFHEKEVPTVSGVLIAGEQDAEDLQIPDVGSARSGECIKGIREAKKRITDRPVLAGMIGPYSLAGRLLDMTEIMVLCYDEPEMVETVLEKVTAFLIAYAKAFKEAGADGIVMAEPAAGLLSPGLIAEFSNPYVIRIKEAVEDDSFQFIYHNCGYITPIMQQINAVQATAFSVGNAIDMKDAMELLPKDSLILGNIDPVGTLRNKKPNEIRQEVLAFLEQFASYPNFVMASGCDIPPDTPIENLDAFFAAIQEFYGEKA